MKETMNFRLSPDVKAIILMLKTEMNTSGTNIVEEALRLYAKKMSHEHPLLKYAGKLSNKDAENILTHIRKNRTNKKLDLDL